MEKSSNFIGSQVNFQSILKLICAGGGYRVQRWLARPLDSVSNARCFSHIIWCRGERAGDYDLRCFALVVD